MKHFNCFALVVFFVLACTTSPTGRKQLILLPENQMESMGAQAFTQMKAKTPVERDPRFNEYAKCVSTPLTEVGSATTEAKNWEIVVFKDASANAFALPGGKIGIHTGLIKVAQTDAQLAAVVGHEIGHVIARHGNERVSEGIVAQSGLTAVGALTPENPKSQLLLGLLGVGAQVGILLPHSRTQESEADLIGLDIMARAGFDPRESVKLWQNMIKASGGGAPPQFLSTHPASESRIQNLSAHMKEAMVKFENAERSGRKPRCARPQI